VANLIVVPLMGYGAVVIGFAGLVLTVVFPPAGHWFLALAGMLVDAANWGIGICASLPVWRGVSPTLIETMLLTGIVLVFGLGHVRWRLSAVIALAACVGMLRILEWQPLVVAAARHGITCRFVDGRTPSTLIG